MKGPPLHRSWDILSQAVFGASRPKLGVGRCGLAAPIHRRRRPRCPRSFVKRSAVIGEDEEWGQPSIVNGHWERERSRSFLGRDLCPKGPFIESCY